TPSYDQGRERTRSPNPPPDGKASQTMVGYKWNKNNTAVELIYFTVAANGNDQQFHTLSLHYKRSSTGPKPAGRRTRSPSQFRRQRPPHDVQRRWTSEPPLEAQRALVQQHGKTIL